MPSPTLSTRPISCRSPARAPWRRRDACAVSSHGLGCERHGRHLRAVRGRSDRDPPARNCGSPRAARRVRCRRSRSGRCGKLSLRAVAPRACASMSRQSRLGCCIERHGGAHFDRRRRRARRAPDAAAQCLGQAFEERLVECAGRHALRAGGAQWSAPDRAASRSRASRMALLIARDRLLRVGLQLRAAASVACCSSGRAFGLGRGARRGEDALAPRRPGLRAAARSRRLPPAALRALPRRRPAARPSPARRARDDRGDRAEQEVRQQPDENEDVDRLQRECPRSMCITQCTNGLANSSSSAMTRQ